MMLTGDCMKLHKRLGKMQTKFEIMQKPVTLKDLARETGVHVSTVCRALDPNFRGSLSDAVVTRVRDAAQRMGYRPNRLASGLRTNRTMTVGIMLPDITNTLFPPIVRGVESVLERLGYAAILVNTDSDPQREERLLNVLLERGVDGIINAAAHLADPAFEMASRNIPVVTANRLTDSASLPSVVNDDVAGIAMMLQHLVEAGHRKIAHIAGPSDLSTGVTRRHAFVQHAKQLGLDLPEIAIETSEGYSEAEGRASTQALLARDWPMTAILCANDRIAIGAIDTLRAVGLSCPGDVSVTGFNDIPFLDRIPPGLTTIQVMQFDVGRIAAELLVQMMTDPGATVPSNVVLPVKLIERGSVAAPRTTIQHRPAAE